jgi:hypothetical protein
MNEEINTCSENYNDNCLSCGQESHYGIVSVDKNRVLHRHYCKPCYLKQHIKQSSSSVAEQTTV